MAHITPDGTVNDERQKAIRRRRAEHDIYSMKGSLVKFEIAIMESEANIERSRQSIIDMTADIEKREAKLAESE